MQVLGCYQFRVTRNSDLFVDDEEVDDLRRALEGELAHRRYGAAVRLETAPTARRKWSISCCGSSRSARSTGIRCPGPVNLNRLSAIYDLVERPDLKYPLFTPGTGRRL